MKTYKNIDEARADKNRCNGGAKQVWMIDNNGDRCYVLASAPADRWIGKPRGKNGIIVLAGYDILSAKEKAEAEAEEKNTIEVYLSSRGWGDYSGVAPELDMRKPEAELIAACRLALSAEDDIDQPDQSDAEILAAINAARTKLARRNAPPAPAPIYGPGYCFSCESYCYGDCNDYQPVRTSRMISKQAQAAAQEADYGIND
jgi:hypothetical protein